MIVIVELLASECAVSRSDLRYTSGFKGRWQWQKCLVWGVIKNSDEQWVMLQRVWPSFIPSVDSGSPARCWSLVVWIHSHTALRASWAPAVIFSDSIWLKAGTTHRSKVTDGAEVTALCSSVQQTEADHWCVVFASWLWLLQDLKQSNGQNWKDRALKHYML